MRVLDRIVGVPPKVRRFLACRRAANIVIGSAGISFPGWFSTSKETLDVCDRGSFARYWNPNSRSAFLAEHVWEHLTLEAAAKASRNCFEFLKPGGRLRIAVPDGLHPDPGYVEQVRPGGTGDGAADHKVLYTFKTLKGLLEEAGFEVELLEYWDESRTFHFQEWLSEDGHIRRSMRFDPRNRGGSRSYTSLIADARKP